VGIKEIPDKVTGRFRKKRYTTKEELEQEFTAYIIKGNRQVATRQVVASKRFLVDGDTYVVKPQCIFLKNVGGSLKSVSYYREGNPNPYDFQKKNLGLDNDELDRLFSEDFFHIVTDLQKENKMVYLFLIALINMVLTVLMMVGVLMFQ